MKYVFIAFALFFILGIGYFIFISSTQSSFDKVCKGSYGNSFHAALRGVNNWYCIDIHGTIKSP
jgi:hypothetical protein